MTPCNDQRASVRGPSCVIHCVLFPVFQGLTDTACHVIIHGLCPRYYLSELTFYDVSSIIRQTRSQAPPCLLFSTLTAGERCDDLHRYQGLTLVRLATR